MYRFIPTTFFAKVVEVWLERIDYLAKHKTDI
jgi:hypothetical protein